MYFIIYIDEENLCIVGGELVFKGIKAVRVYSEFWICCLPHFITRILNYAYLL